MAKMASLHAEQFDVSRETNETPYTAGFRAGLDWFRLATKSLMEKRQDAGSIPDRSTREE